MPKFTVNGMEVYACSSSSYGEVSLYTPSGNWDAVENLSNKNVYLFDIDGDGTREIVDIYNSQRSSRNRIKIEGRSDSLSFGDETEFICKDEVDEIERASYISPD